MRRICEPKRRDPLDLRKIGEKRLIAGGSAIETAADALNRLRELAPVFF